MKRNRITVTDGIYIDAGFDVEGEADILVVDVEVGVPCLRMHIGCAYRKASADAAPAIAAEYASGTRDLVQASISEPVEV